MQVNDKNFLLDQINNNSVSAILFYGSDIGLIEVLNKWLEKKLNLIIETVDFADITPDSYRIFIQSINLFETKKIIKIVNVSEKISKEMKEILHISGNNIAFFIAPKIRANSEIRKFFEITKNLVCYPCYPIKENNIRKLTESLLKGKTISHGAMNYLVGTYNGDYQLYINEVKKLTLYSMHNSSIEIEDIVALVNNVGKDFDFKQICYSLLLRDKEGFFNSIKYSNNTSLIQIIRGVLFALTQVNSGVVCLRENPRITVQEIIRQRKLSIFFQDIHQYQEVLYNVTESEIARLLYLLLEAEKKIKLIGEKSYIIEKVYFDFYDSK